MKLYVASMIAIILGIMFLVGCTTKKSPSPEIGKMKQNKHFEITLNQIKPYTPRDRMEKKPPKDVVQVDIMAKNKTNVEHGIGSLEFKAFDIEGKELSHYGYADNMGDIVGIGDTLKGSIFFVAKEANIATIEYVDPDNQERVTWRINPIKK
ncbi:DUF4352 domain-containing protein [Bacillus mycoides]|nr:DUF4352 domain-containing protein [Bacillus mycoides]